MAPKADPTDEAAAAQPSGENGENGYYPRAALTKGPQPLAPVNLPYPSFEGDTGNYRAEVALYIDENGVVQRIDVPEGVLPKALATAVRAAFSSTQFRPGELDGRPVRTLLKIEVRFDATPIPASAAG